MTAAASAIDAFGRAAAGFRQALSQVEGARPHVANGSSHASQMNELFIRLGGQRQRLTALAAKARLPAPVLEGVPPAPFTTPEAMLDMAATAVAHTDEALNTLQGMVLPPLLPSVSPTTRTALVFGASSVVAWTLQCGLLIATNGTDLRSMAVSLCGMPILAFGAALLVLQFAGQPRAGDRISHPVKLGAIICFLGMPIAWILLLLAMVALR